MIWLLRMSRGFVVFLALFAITACMFPGLFDEIFYRLAVFVGGLGWVFSLFTWRIIAKDEIKSIERKRLSKDMVTQGICCLGYNGCKSPTLFKCTKHWDALMGEDEAELPGDIVPVLLTPHHRMFSHAEIKKMQDETLRLKNLAVTYCGIDRARQNQDVATFTQNTLNLNKGRNEQ